MNKAITEQALNKVTIVGTLLDATFGDGTQNDGRRYNRATATIRVTQTFNGQQETSEIPVSFYSTQYTKSGGINPAWQNIENLRHMKTVQEVGLGDADTVRITGANLQENNFVTKSGQFVTGWQLRASFINSVKGIHDAAVFDEDIFIMDMYDETDKEGDPTGRLVIKGGIVQYGGKLDVVNFVVEAHDSIDYIQRNWEPNTTVNARGFIRVTSVEEKSSGSSSSWGEDIPETTTKMVRELVITKGSDEAKEEEFAYNPTDIKKAFNVRKANIEQLQIDAKNKVAKPAATTTAPASKYDWE